MVEVNLLGKTISAKQYQWTAYNSTIHSQKCFGCIHDLALKSIINENSLADQSKHLINFIANGPQYHFFFLNGWHNQKPLSHKFFTYHYINFHFSYNSSLGFQLYTILKSIFKLFFYLLSLFYTPFSRILTVIIYN